MKKFNFDFKLSKKTVIPIIILLVILLVVSMFSKVKKSRKNEVPLEVELQEEKNTEEEVLGGVEDIIDISNENDEVLETEEINPGNIEGVLAFGKDDGVLTLYDHKGKLVDFVDLNVLNGNSSETVDLSEASSVTNKNLIKEIKKQIEEEENKEHKDALEKVLEKYLGDEKEEKDIGETERREGFKTFRTINNELIFYSYADNSLFLARVKDEKIMVSSLLKDFNLDTLTSSSIYENSIYLTLKDDKNIYKVNKVNGKANMEKYELDEVPYFLLVEENSLYYVASQSIGKLDLENMSEEDIAKANIGDSVSSFYQDKDFIYLISEFGKNDNNSVIIKVNKETLLVENMTELKGINSIFIGSNGKTVQIRQKDSLKEIDLDTLKPKKAISRKEGVPVQVKGDILYMLEDGFMKVYDLNTSKQINEFKVEGFTFHLF